MHGDTLTQCIARYGPIREEAKPGGPLLFVKPPFLIYIVFEHGKAANLNYQLLATDNSAHDHSKPINNNDIKALLNSNSRGVPWREGKSTKKHRVWKSTDGKLAAFYILSWNVLNIQTCK